jgi:hypothetical protein
VNDRDLRLSDAEREQAAAELAEHYAQGRLTHEEHGERLDRIWAARTRGDLRPVFVDLPGRYAAPAAARPAYAQPRGWSGGRPASWRRGVPTPVYVVLAILLVVTVVTHLPLILIGLLVWFVLSQKLRRHHHPHRW